ncbi:MAG: type II toxin-antitoxin system VapC family toxin [Bacteroidetes bacterium]|nr:type II toxin-antitoxin system VapC family toxin [Bacteroidota bacterium]
MKRLPKKGLLFLAGAINEDFTISFITYIEFLGYKDVSKESEEFISLASVIEIDKPIMDACVSLRKANKIKLPDAIIAATALVYDLVVISRNTADFKNIDGLQVIDPHSL